jgi:hypothetical protein
MLVGKTIGKRLKLVYKGKTLVRLAMPSFYLFHFIFLIAIGRTTFLEMFITPFVNPRNGLQ